MSKNLLSKKQKEALKKPCSKCAGKMIEIGDLDDYDHNNIMCEKCQNTIMADGSSCQ